MARAADYPTLYDFEGQIESAADTVLSTLVSDVRRERDTDDLATPRVTCQFTVDRADEQLAELPNGELRPRLYHGTLGISIVTNRNNDASSHNAFRSKVRTLLGDWRKQFTVNGLLSYVQILRCHESGGSPASFDEGLDISAMTWSVTFGIQSDAWPV